MRVVQLMGGREKHGVAAQSQTAALRCVGDVPPTPLLGMPSQGRKTSQRQRRSRDRKRDGKRKRKKKERQ